jgi:nicotinamide mononucleotide transporter
MTLTDLIGQVGTTLATTGWVEALAASTGILYLVLVIRQNRWCWIAAFVSTALYLYVFYAAALYLQALLQIFYLAMAIYGWLQWGGTGAATRAISRWPWRRHLIALAVIVPPAVAVAWLLARAVNSPAPYLDSLTTWASVFTTWLVARKILENWLWWLVIDSVIAVMCWQQQLYASALLYAAYLLLVLLGWRSWHRDWQSQAGAR